MLGWIAQKYWIVPAFSGVNENDEPWAIVPESSSPPDLAVTVCAAESSFVQVIFWPTFALIVCGANANPLIATDSPAPAGLAGAAVAAGVVCRGLWARVLA